MRWLSLSLSLSVSIFLSISIYLYLATSLSLALSLLILLSLCRDRGPGDLLAHWAWLSLGGLGLGWLLHGTGALPFNTDLYSPSFLLFTNGASTAALALCYLCSDVHGSRLLEPFRWLGMNSIAIYLFACSGLPQALLGCLYWGERDANLANILWPTGVYWGPKHTDDWLPPANEHQATQGQMSVLLWCLLGYIPTWILVAGYMHHQNWYFKV